MDSINRIVNLVPAEIDIIQKYIREELVHPGHLNYIHKQFVKDFRDKNTVPVDVDTMTKLKEKYINNLIVLFPVTDNRFHFISNLISIIKNKHIIPTQLIFFERQSGKVEEWVKTELPMFHQLPIYNIFTMLNGLCRIVWRKK
jgi:hypothetical protein